MHHVPIATPEAGFRPRGTEVDRVRAYLRDGAPLVLVGPTGCGKTTLVRQMAIEIGRPLVTVVGDTGLSVNDLLGRWHLTAAGSEWRDGPLTRAARDGSVFYLDEIGAVPEGVLKALHPLLDHRRELHLPARPETVQAASGFRFVASFNPGYGEGGRGLTPAFRQRCRFVSLDYLAYDDEKKLLLEMTGLPENDASFLVDVAHLTREKMRGSLPEGASTRLLLMAAEGLLAGRTDAEVLEDCIVGPLTDDLSQRGALFHALRAAGLLSAEDLQTLRLPEPPPTSFAGADEDFFDTGN